MPRKPLIKRKLSLVGFALLIISLSVSATLYLAGVPLVFWNSSPAAEQRYRATGLGDARAACQARAHAVFGRRISSLQVDNFSSRLDQGEQRYKIFMEAEIYPSSDREGVPRDTYINCFTGVDSVEVELFQYARDGEQFIAPSEESRGRFGI